MKAAQRFHHLSPKVQASLPSNESRLIRRLLVSLCATAFPALLCCLGLPVASGAQTFTTVYSFNLTANSNTQSALSQGIDGRLYAPTVYGGSGGGTVYAFAPAATLTTVASFKGPQGLYPFSRVVQDPGGILYGTTNNGGTGSSCAKGCGTVYKIANGKLTVLHSFISSDGVTPQGGVVRGFDGNLYGTTYSGGSGDGGTIFKVTPAGTFSILYNFNATSGGYNPYSGLVQATDGNLYGTTFRGGATNAGTIFRITLSGTFTVLHDFCTIGLPCADGGNSTAPLMQGSDGNLYGVTNRYDSDFCVNGPYLGCGVVFKITLGGNLTPLHAFDGTDGGNPTSGLTEGTDGNFYGVTAYYGGNTTCINNGCGTVFSVTPAGVLTTLHTFCTDDGCADGMTPVGTLVQDTDGSFYGTTTGGGSGGAGTIYNIALGLAPFVRTNPAAAKVSQMIRILGTNLTGATGVTFNGTPATFTVGSSTFITATIPGGATTGPIQVTTPSGTLISNLPFQVVP